MSNLSKPIITGSQPSPDDDPTGVRALLSSLPAPDPMPAQLVERINASLAEEQIQRAASGSPGSTVSPLLALRRRRPARLLVALAGAAAALVLVAVVGSNIFSQSVTTSQTSLASPSGGDVSRSAENGAGALSAPGAADAKAPTAKAKTYSDSAAGPTLVQIRLSGTRYTQADFVTQVQALREVILRSKPPQGSGVGTAGTTAGLRECLDAIGAGRAQDVRADVAFYQGKPALVIAATTNDVSVAYVVGRQCSHADPAVLRPATPLS